MSTTRRSVAAALIALIAVVLAACGRIDIDLSVDEDLQVNGTIRMEGDSSVFGGLMGTSMDLASSLEEALSYEVYPEGITASVIDEDDLIGVEFTIENVPADEMSGDGVDDFSFTRDGDEFVFRSTNPATEVLSSNVIGTSSEFSWDEATLTVTFPGTVISAEGGQINGNTVTWDLLSHTGDLSARAEIGGGFPLWAWILIGVGILTLIGLIVVLLLLRSRKQGKAGQGPYTDGGYPGTPQGFHTMPPGGGYPATSAQQGYGVQGQFQQPVNNPQPPPHPGSYQQHPYQQGPIQQGPGQPLQSAQGGYSLSGYSQEQQSQGHYGYGGTTGPVPPPPATAVPPAPGGGGGGGSGYGSAGGYTEPAGGTAAPWAPPVPPEPALPLPETPEYVPESQESATEEPASGDTDGTGSSPQ